MNKFKLRAECLHDVKKAIEELKIKNWLIEPNGSPDVTLTFSTVLDINEILICLDRVPDSHVMVETLMPEQLYTGIRDYPEGEKYYQIWVGLFPNGGHYAKCKLDALAEYASLGGHLYLVTQIEEHEIIEDEQ